MITFCRLTMCIWSSHSLFNIIWILPACSHSSLNVLHISHLKCVLQPSVGTEQHDHFLNSRAVDPLMQHLLAVAFLRIVLGSDPINLKYPSYPRCFCKTASFSLCSKKIFFQYRNIWSHNLNCYLQAVFPWITFLDQVFLLSSNISSITYWMSISNLLDVSSTKEGICLFKSLCMSSTKSSVWHLVGMLSANIVKWINKWILKLTCSNTVLPPYLSSYMSSQESYHHLYEHQSQKFESLPILHSLYLIYPIIF